MNWNFYRKLHTRGVTLKVLAAELQTSQGHLSDTINGKRGNRTRKHLVKLLTEEEREILGWNERGELVPHGTNSQLVKSSEDERDETI